MCEQAAEAERREDGERARLPSCSVLSVLAVLAVLSASAVPRLHAQADTEVEQSRRRLEEIRASATSSRSSSSGCRARSRRQRRAEQPRAPAGSTQRIVNEIERQIGGLATQLDRSSAELALAEDNLAERQAVLERRLADIYKRGPLYTFQVLLAAESFGDLLSRYKYLYLTSRQDRALVTDVEKLAQSRRQRAERHSRRARPARPHAGRSARRSTALRRAGRGAGERRLAGAPALGPGAPSSS